MGLFGRKKDFALRRYGRSYEDELGMLSGVPHKDAEWEKRVTLDYTDENKFCPIEAALLHLNLLEELTPDIINMDDSTEDDWREMQGVTHVIPQLYWPAMRAYERWEQLKRVLATKDFETPFRQLEEACEAYRVRKGFGTKPTD